MKNIAFGTYTLGQSNKFISNTRSITQYIELLTNKYRKKNEKESLISMSKRFSVPLSKAYQQYSLFEISQYRDASEQFLVQQQ